MRRLAMPKIDDPKIRFIRWSRDASETKVLQYAFQMQIAQGEGNRVLDPDHSLVRAFKASLVKGRPPDEWRIVLFHDEPGRTPMVFGTVVRTLGNRFLYFPGVGMHLGSIDHLVSRKVSLDHVTVDRPDTRRGRRGGHITLLGQHGKGGHTWKFRTRPRNGWHYCFSILTPTLEAFPRLPALITLPFTSGRTNLLEGQLEFASKGGLASLELPRAPQSPSFVQIDVWVGDETRDDARAPEPRPFLLKPGIVQERPEEQTTDFKLLGFDFASGEKVAFGITSLVGHISQPILIRDGVHEAS
jgi:hypothetical protein